MTLIASTWTVWAQTVIAVGALATAALVPLTAYWRRPSLWLSEDTEGANSRVEANGIAYLRLLIGNKKRKRAAQGTRMIVESYHPRTAPAEVTTLGHPSLDWPSAPEAADTATVVMFGGWSRPVGFGRLIHVQRDAEGAIMRAGGFPHTPPGQGRHPLARSFDWNLWLDLAFHRDILDDRDKLPPTEGGYTVRLAVGADDGTARRYDVDIDWDGDAEDAEKALASVTLTVHAVR